MKTSKKANRLILPLFLILMVAAACTEDDGAGPTFNSDFDYVFLHGGMVPDTGIFTADFPGADEYSWVIAGNPHSGPIAEQDFTAVNNYGARLTVVMGGESKSSDPLNIPLENHPPGGSTITVIQDNGNGDVGTIVISADPLYNFSNIPFWADINEVGSGGHEGIDYDDEKRFVYYAKSPNIIRSFPNGAEPLPISGDLSAGEEITDLVIDSDDKKLYYAIKKTNGYSSIAKINLQSFIRTDLLNFNSGTIKHITLDEAANRVYFSTEGSTLYYSDSDGQVNQITPASSNVYALTFDNQEDKLYYAGKPAGSSNYSIYSYDGTSSHEEIITTDISIPIRGLDIDENKQLIYWTDQENNKVHCKGLLGNDPEIKVYIRANSRALAVGNFEI